MKQFTKNVPNNTSSRPNVDLMMKVRILVKDPSGTKAYLKNLHEIEFVKNFTQKRWNSKIKVSLIF